jgi:hypothetical protein
MNKPTLRLLATAVIAALSAASMWADSVSINPALDTWASPPSDAASLNLNDTVLKVKNTGIKERAFLMFDLSAVPPGAVIDSATLTMYMSQAPTKDGNPNPGTKITRNYNLSRADVAWTAGTSNMLNSVPPVASIATVATGTVDGVAKAWGGANFVTEVTNSLAGTKQLSLVAFDASETGAGGTPKYEAWFASNEDGNSANRPTLVINYHVPVGPPPGCDEGTLTISHNDYVGPNPIPWSLASSPSFFTVHFTITAGCKDLTNIKAQGGVASNLVIGQWSADLGAVTSKAVGQGNQVLTWRIDSLPAGNSANLYIPVSGGYNNQGKAACGPKNLTGDWSANGYWLNGSVAKQAFSNVGELLVDFDCLH